MESRSALGLRQYVDILRRHKWFIVELVLVIGVTQGVVSNSRTPLYKSTARVLLTPNDPTQQLNPTSGNGVAGKDPDRYVAGQINIVRSEGVASEAAKTLSNISASTVEGKLNVSQDGHSNVLRISAADPDPERASDIAEAVAKGYIENRRLAAVSGLQGAADNIQAKLGPLQAQIAQLDAQIGDPSPTAALTAPAKSTSGQGPAQPASQVASTAGTTGGAATTQEALKAARYAAAVQYETLYSRQQELVVDISLKRGDAELIADARTPSAPVSPHPKRDAAFAAIIGLVLGIGISVLRTQLNDRLSSPAEVESVTGVPLLAQLPYDGDAGKDRGRGVAMIERPASAFSEAVRSLRTSIQYVGVEQPVKIIIVTSAAPGEGKSLVATNLAVAFAQADYRALLISADLRRSTVDAMLGVPSGSRGLTSVLAPLPITRSSGSSNGPSMLNDSSRGEPSPVTAIVKTHIQGLLLLPSGPTPPNPAELLGSRRMATLLKEYAEQSDIIIIDSPPLLPVTDAAVLAAQSDGVVLVTALNETRRDAAARARAILAATGTRVLGVVANKAPLPGRRGLYYGSYYGNTSSEPPNEITEPGVSVRSAVRT